MTPAVTIIGAGQPSTLGRLAPRTGPEPTP